MNKLTNICKLRQSWIMSFVSTCVAFIVFVTGTFIAPPPLAGAETISPQVHFQKIDFENLVIPEKLGKVSDFFRGNSAHTVILVQDAHAIPDAQRNIHNLIKYFQNEYGVSLVGLEGTEGPLDVQFLNSFPDKKILKNIFKEYYEQGELTGGNGAALFDSTASTYWGVEDWDLYEEGITLYQQAYFQREAFATALQPIATELINKKNSIYSKKLITLDQSIEKFYDHFGGMLEFVQALAEIKKPAAGSELDAMLQEANRDKRGDTESLYLEAKKLAQGAEDFLAQTGDKSDLKNFHSKKQEFETGQIQAEHYVKFIQEIMAGHGLQPKLSVALAGLVKKEQKLADIEGTKFFDEFKSYIDDVMLFAIQQDLGNSANKDQARELYRQTQDLRVIEKLSKLEVSTDEYAELKSNAFFKPETFKAQVAFYENAKKRDQTLYHNLIKKHQEMAGKVADANLMLIAGGFHAHGITRLLEEANTSYVLLMPSIQKIPEQSVYEQQMLGNVSWKDYFEVVNGKVNLYEAFARAARDKLISGDSSGVAGGIPRGGVAAGTVPDVQILKSWRDQIIRDLSKQGRVEESGKYTRFIDEKMEKTTDQRLKTTDNKIQWAKNINRFIKGLLKLEKENNITQQNIAQLLKPGFAPAAAVAASFSRQPAAETIVTPTALPSKIVPPVISRTPVSEIEALGSAAINQFQDNSYVQGLLKDPLYVIGNYEEAIANLKIAKINTILTIGKSDARVFDVMFGNGYRRMLIVYDAAGKVQSVGIGMSTIMRNIEIYGETFVEVPSEYHQRIVDKLNETKDRDGKAMDGRIADSDVDVGEEGINIRADMQLSVPVGYEWSDVLQKWMRQPLAQAILGMIKSDQAISFSPEGLKIFSVSVFGGMKLGNIILGGRQSFPERSHEILTHETAHILWSTVLTKEQKKRWKDFVLGNPTLTSFIKNLKRTSQYGKLPLRMTDWDDDFFDGDFYDEALAYALGAMGSETAWQIESPAGIYELNDDVINAIVELIEPLKPMKQEITENLKRKERIYSLRLATTEELALPSYSHMLFRPRKKINTGGSETKKSKNGFGSTAKEHPYAREGGRDKAYNPKSQWPGEKMDLIKIPVKFDFMELNLNLNLRSILNLNSNKRLTRRSVGLGGAVFASATIAILGVGGLTVWIPAILSGLVMGALAGGFYFGFNKKENINLQSFEREEVKVTLDELESAQRRLETLKARDKSYGEISRTSSSTGDALVRHKNLQEIKSLNKSILELKEKLKTPNITRSESRVGGSDVNPDDSNAARLEAQQKAGRSEARKVNPEPKDDSTALLSRGSAGDNIPLSDEEFAVGLKTLRLFEISEKIEAYEYSADGKFLFVSYEGRLAIYDIERSRFLEMNSAPALFSNDYRSKALNVLAVSGNRQRYAFLTWHGEVSNGRAIEGAGSNIGWKISVVDVQTGSVQDIYSDTGFVEDGLISVKKGIRLSEDGNVLSIPNLANVAGTKGFDHYYLSPEGATDAQPARFSSNYEDSDSVYATDYVIATKRGGRLISLKRSSDQIDLMSYVKPYVDLDGDITISTDGRYLEGKVSGGSKVINSLYRWTADPKRKGRIFSRLIHWTLNLLYPNFFKRRVLDLAMLSSGMDFLYFETLGKAEAVVVGDDGWLLVHYLDGTKSAVLPSARKKISIKKGSEVLAFLDSRNKVYQASTNLVRGGLGEEEKPVAGPHGNDAQLSGQADQYILIREGYRTLGLIEKATGNKTTVKMDIPEKQMIDFDTLKQHGKYLTMSTLDNQFLYVVDGESGKVVYEEENIMRSDFSDVVLHRSPYTNHLVVQTISAAGKTSVIDLDSQKVVNRIPSGLDIEFNEDYTEYEFGDYTGSSSASVYIILHNVHFLEGGKEMVVYTNIADPGQTRGPRRFVSGPYPMKVAVVSKNEKPKSSANDLDFFYPETVEEIGVFTKAETAQRDGSYVGVNPWKKVSKIITPFLSRLEGSHRTSMTRSPNGQMAMVSISDDRAPGRGGQSLVMHDLEDALEDLVLAGVSNDLFGEGRGGGVTELAPVYRNRILNSFSLTSLSALDEDGRNLLADQFSRGIKDLFERPYRKSGEVAEFIDRIVAIADAMGENGESFLHQIANGMRKSFYLGNENHEDYKYARASSHRTMDYLQLKTDQSGREVWEERTIGNLDDVPDLERGSSGLERIKDTLADFSMSMLQNPGVGRQEPGAQLKGVVEAVEQTLLYLPNNATQMTPQERSRALLRHIFNHYSDFLINKATDILEMSGREVRDVRINAPGQRSPRIDFLETYLKVAGFDEMVAELSTRFPELQLLSTGWDLFDSLYRFQGVQQLYDEMAHVETLEPAMQAKYLEKKKADTIFGHYTMKFGLVDEHFERGYMRRISASMSVIGTRETLSLIRLAQRIARPDETPELTDALLLSTTDVDKLLTTLLESTGVNAKLFALQLISAFMEVNQEGSYKLSFSPDVLNIAAKELRNLTPIGMRQLIHKQNQGLRPGDRRNPTDDDINQLHRSYSTIMEKAVDLVVSFEPNEEDRSAFIKFAASGFSAGQGAREKITDYLLKVAKGEDLNLGPYFQKYIFEKKDGRLLGMMMLNDSVKERLVRMGNALAAARGDGSMEREFSAQEDAFVDFFVEVAEGVISASAAGRDLGASLDKLAEAMEQAAPKIKELFSKLSSQDLTESERPKVGRLVDLVMDEFKEIVDPVVKIGKTGNMNKIRPNLSATEFALAGPTMAVDIGTNGWSEKAYKEAIQIFLDANHWAIDDLAEPVKNAGELFGYSVIFKYMDRLSPTARHDSIIGFEKVIALGLAIQNANPKDPKPFEEFKNNIVLTAGAGALARRYADFIYAVEVFSVEWRKTYEVDIKDAFEGTATGNQTTGVSMEKIFDNPGLEFKTKPNFFATAKFIRSLANIKLMDLIRDFRRDKSDPRNAKVAAAIVALVNTGVDIDPKALEQFVLDPYEFYGRPASHVFPKSVQDALSAQNLFFKPAISKPNGSVKGHFGVPYIDLTAEDFVKGSLSGQLDNSMAMHPDMENEGLPIYTLFDSGLFFKMLQSPLFAPTWQAEVFGYKHDRGNGAEESIFDMASLVAYVNYRRSKGELGGIQDGVEITEDNVLDFMVEHISEVNIKEMLSAEPDRPVVKLKSGYEDFYNNLTGPGIGMPPMPVLLAFRARAIQTILGIDKKQADGDTSLNAEEEKFIEFKKGLETKTVKGERKTLGQAVLGEKFTVRILAKSNPESLITNNRAASCARFGDGKKNIYDVHNTMAELVLVKEVPGAPGSDSHEEVLATSVVTLGIPTGANTAAVLNNLKADIEASATLNAAKALAGGDFESRSGEYLQVTLDNIEGNPKFHAILEEQKELSDGFTWNDFVQTGFKYYFADYLLKHSHSRGVPGSRRGPALSSEFVIGTANSDFHIGNPKDQKDTAGTVTTTLLSYTDAKGLVDSISTGIGPRDAFKPEKGVFKLDARDTWHVANLEAQVYGDSSLLQGIVEIQNALLGSNDLEQIKGPRRANLSQGFFDEKGQLLGYMIAYAGWDQENQREIIYVMDMVVHPDHRKTKQDIASRLTRSFIKAIKANGLTDMPIIAELVKSDTGSYQHVKDLVERDEKRFEAKKKKEGFAFDPTKASAYKFVDHGSAGHGRQSVELQPLGAVVSRPLPVNAVALDSGFYSISSQNITAAYPHLERISKETGLDMGSIRSLIESGAVLQMYVNNGEPSGFVLGGPTDLFKNIGGHRQPREGDGQDTFFMSHIWEDGPGVNTQLQLLARLVNSLSGDFDNLSGYVSGELATKALDVARQTPSLVVEKIPNSDDVYVRVSRKAFKVYMSDLNEGNMAIEIAGKNRSEARGNEAIDPVAQKEEPPSDEKRSEARQGVTRSESRHTKYQITDADKAYLDTLGDEMLAVDKVIAEALDYAKVYPPQYFVTTDGSYKYYEDKYAGDKLRSALLAGGIVFKDGVYYESPPKSMVVIEYENMNVEHSFFKRMNEYHSIDIFRVDELEDIDEIKTFLEELKKNSDLLEKVRNSGLASKLFSFVIAAEKGLSIEASMSSQHRRNAYKRLRSSLELIYFINPEILETAALNADSAPGIQLSVTQTLLTSHVEEGLLPVNSLKLGVELAAAMVLRQHQFNHKKVSDENLSEALAVLSRFAKQMNTMKSEVPAPEWAKTLNQVIPRIMVTYLASLNIQKKPLIQGALRSLRNMNLLDSNYASLILDMYEISKIENVEFESDVLGIMFDSIMELTSITSEEKLRIDQQIVRMAFYRIDENEMREERSRLTQLLTVVNAGEGLAYLRTLKQADLHEPGYYLIDKYSTDKAFLESVLDDKDIDVRLRVVAFGYLSSQHQQLDVSLKFREEVKSYLRELVANENLVDTISESHIKKIMRTPTVVHELKALSLSALLSMDIYPKDQVEFETQDLPKLVNGIMTLALVRGYDNASSTYEFGSALMRRMDAPSLIMIQEHELEHNILYSMGISSEGTHGRAIHEFMSDVHAYQRAESLGFPIENYLKMSTAETYWNDVKGKENSTEPYESARSNVFEILGLIKKGGIDVSWEEFLKTGYEILSETDALARTDFNKFLETLYAKVAGGKVAGTLKPVVNTKEESRRRSEVRAARILIEFFNPKKTNAQISEDDEVLIVTVAKEDAPTLRALIIELAKEQGLDVDAINESSGNSAVANAVNFSATLLAGAYEDTSDDEVITLALRGAQATVVNNLFAKLIELKIKAEVLTDPKSYDLAKKLAKQKTVQVRKVGGAWTAEFVLKGESQKVVPVGAPKNAELNSMFLPLIFGERESVATEDEVFADSLIYSSFLIAIAMITSTKQFTVDVEAVFSKGGKSRLQAEADVILAQLVEFGGAFGLTNENIKNILAFDGKAFTFNAKLITDILAARQAEISA